MPSKASQPAESPSRCGEDRSAVSLPVLPSTPASGPAPGPRIRKSRNGPRRAAVLILVHVLMIAHIIQWQLQGDTLSPVEPSDSMKTLVQGAVNAGAVFFAVAILSTLIFGRFFCGWGCHVVAMQDACAWFMKKLGVRPKPFRSRILVWAPVLFAFYMFLWPNFSRFVYEPLAERFFPAALNLTGRIVPFPAEGFRNHLITDDFWATFPPLYVAIPFLLICGLAVVYFLGAKGFCTYGCPYGGIFGPVDRLAPGKIKVDQDKCHQCGHCTAVCTSNVRVHDEIREYGMVVDPGCMKCLDCVSVCPNNALSFAFARPTVLKGAPRHKAPRRHYDMTVGEDLVLGVVMLACFLAVRGAYDVVPALFAAGLAAILTFLFFKFWRVLVDRDVRLMTFQLKRLGRLTSAGRLFAALIGATILLTLHTGYVNYHRWQGDRIVKRLNISSDAAVAVGRPPFPDATRAQARRALEHYAVTAPIGRGGMGLLDTSATMLDEALMRLVVDEPAPAQALIQRVIIRENAPDSLLVDLGRVKRFQGDTQGELSLLERSLSEDPRRWNVRHELAQLRLAAGNPQPAVAEAESALKWLPNHWKTRDARARTRLTLALLYASTQRGDEALTLLREAIDIRPHDAHLRDSYAGALAMLRGDLPAAVQQLILATRADPLNPTLWLRLAQFRIATGDDAGALDAFENAARLNPHRAGYREMIEQMILQAGREDLAQRWRDARPRG